MGYEYQDLVAIEALIRFYRDPKSCSWVELEADKTDSSLDDVVVARSDGSLEYYQVKFTVDQIDYPLTWDWLLEKKPRGTSLLGKWANSMKKVAKQGSIHSASLRTNRIPDADVAVSLKGTLLSLDLIPRDTRLRLEKECGGREAALAFFGKFEFVHSARNFDAYESHLRDQLVPTDMEASGSIFGNVSGDGQRGVRSRSQRAESFTSTSLKSFRGDAPSPFDRTSASPWAILFPRPPSIPNFHGGSAIRKRQSQSCGVRRAVGKAPT